MEEHLARRGYGRGAQVVPARGGARAEDDGVALRERPLQSGGNCGGLVRDYAVAARQRAPAPEHGGEDAGVELHDLTLSGGLAGRHQLVARRDDADDGTAADLALQHARREHRAQGRGAYLRARGEDHLPGADVLAYLPHVLPGCGRLPQADAAARQGLYLLGHYDGVAARGQGVARVHGDVGSLGQLHRRRLRRPEGGGSRDGGPVHGAGVVVRRADARVDRLIAHPARRVLHADALRLRGEAVFPQPGQIGRAGLVQGRVREILKAHSKLLQLNFHQRAPGQALAVARDAQHAVRGREGAY